MPEKMLVCLLQRRRGGERERWGSTPPCPERMGGWVGGGDGGYTEQPRYKNVL